MEGERHSHSLLDSVGVGSDIRMELLVAMGVVGRSLDCNLLVGDSHLEEDSPLHIVEVAAVDMAVVESSSEELVSSVGEDSRLDVAASRESLVRGSKTYFRALKV